MKTNYQSFLEKIAQSTPADCKKLDDLLTQLWGAGIFSVGEFRKLDARICDLEIRAKFLNP